MDRRVIVLISCSPVPLLPLPLLLCCRCPPPPSVRSPFSCSAAALSRSLSCLLLRAALCSVCSAVCSPCSRSSPPPRPPAVCFRLPAAAAADHTISRAPDVRRLSRRAAVICFMSHCCFTFSHVTIFSHLAGNVGPAPCRGRRTTRLPAGRSALLCCATVYRTSGRNEFGAHVLYLWTPSNEP